MGSLWLSMELIITLHILGLTKSLFARRDGTRAKSNTLSGAARKAVASLSANTDRRAPILRFRCWKPGNFADRSVVGRVGWTPQTNLETEISTHVLCLDTGKKMFKLSLSLNRGQCLPPHPLALYFGLKSDVP